MNHLRLAAASLATLSLTAWGCAEFAGTAGAQNPPPCGGNSTVHMAPIDCSNSKTISGIKGTVRIVVDDNGYVMVTGQVAVPPNVVPPPLFLQVKAHRGVSSNAGFEGRAVPFGADSTILVDLFMPKDLSTAQGDAGCTSQIDAKIVPGQPTTDHVSPVFRIAAPLVGLTPEACQPPNATTVPTTAPVTTAPTSAPTTTVPQTSPTTPASGGGSTTAAPTASSVVGAALPPTGFGWSQVGPLIAAIVFWFGALLVILARRSAAS
jgi:hypothetical protein